MLSTIALAAALMTSPAAHKLPRMIDHPASPAIHQSPQYAVTLHPMTQEDKIMYPGRQNWDKIEWYEAQFKSARIVLIPEHVEEWHNGGLDMA